MAYAPTETQKASNKHAFWTTLDGAVEEVPQHEQLLVLMDANARTGRREKRGVWGKDNRILGADGRDTLNDNEQQLLVFANNHDLALVNTFFGTYIQGRRITYQILSMGEAKNVSTTSQRDNVVANSYGTLRCTLSPLSFPLRTTPQAHRPFFSKPPVEDLS